MILIGSQALNHYIALDRKLHDWDFIMTAEELERFNSSYSKYLVKETEYSLVYDINGEIVEIRNPKTLDESDKHLLEMYFLPETKTPFGLVTLPSINTLYEIKKATALCIEEPKHKYDLAAMEKEFPSQLVFNPNTKNFYGNSEFFNKRLNEIKARQEKATKIKHDFFHKYHIPEYVLHDRLHEMFADLLSITIPTYQRITVAETDISEELFNKLTHEQKISLMVEEVLVLNMERWLIPQMVENGINHRLVDMFYNNNEAMPTYLILKHVCITGLKGEQKYITDFSKVNFFEIEKEWIKAKEKIMIKGGLPEWFFRELFELRKKYREGINVNKGVA